MKFQKLYNVLIAEETSFEDRVNNFFGGTPDQVDASKKDSEENVFAAVFEDGDDHLKILMKKDGGDVTVNIKVDGKSTKQNFSNTDAARKELRKITGKKLQIDYAQASQKESAIQSRKEKENE